MNQEDLNNNFMFIDRAERDNLTASLRAMNTTVREFNPFRGRPFHGGNAASMYISPTLPRKSIDRFGYLFRVGTDCKLEYTPENRAALEELGKTMLDLGTVVDQAQNSIIDSGYTYFGQFVDHDVTLDISSNIDVLQDASQLTNFRSPNLDLDSVYGRGPAIDTFLYDNSPAGQGIKLLIGNNSVAAQGVATNFDLPRTSVGTAIIGDPRNDENLFVAQLHLGFLKFHNAVVDKLRADFPAMNNDQIFRKAQTEVRRHYQWVLVHDFLKTIVGVQLVDDVLNHGPKFFRPHRMILPFPPVRPSGMNSLFMPVEFSVAAYRFGHSMIRDNYRFNQFFSNSGFFWAFTFTKRVVPNNWIINWNNFFSHGTNNAVNKARKIDTRVAFHMGHLDEVTAPNPNVMPLIFMKILSSRNLVRGMALGVPSGQCVANAMSIPPLTEAQLLASSFASSTPQRQQLNQQISQLLMSNNRRLLRKTPLWYYILKEAEVLHQGNQLGSVGGRIITEVFIRILNEDSNSILRNPSWRPQFGVQNNNPNSYKIVDLLRFAGMLNIQGIA